VEIPATAVADAAKFEAGGELRTLESLVVDVSEHSQLVESAVVEVVGESAGVAHIQSEAERACMVAELAVGLEHERTEAAVWDSSVVAQIEMVEVETSSSELASSPRLPPVSELSEPQQPA
jgi:hypothetical protein